MYHPIRFVDKMKQDGVTKREDEIKRATGEINRLSPQ